MAKSTLDHSEAIALIHWHGHTAILKAQRAKHAARMRRYRAKVKASKPKPTLTQTHTPPATDRSVK